MNEQNKIAATKKGRKKTSKFLPLFLIIPYISTFFAVVLFIIAFTDLFEITAWDISGITAIDYGLSFSILAIVSRIYYKMNKRD